MRSVFDVRSATPRFLEQSMRVPAKEFTVWTVIMTEWLEAENTTKKESDVQRNDLIEKHDKDEINDYLQI
jgi:hypothetical protein